MQHDPSAFRRIFGRNYRRQYPTKLPVRVIPDHYVEYDEEWRYVAHQWLGNHPWDKEFRARFRAVEKSGDARDFESDYFVLLDCTDTGCYQ
jgi:hypothetical protein